MNTLGERLNYARKINGYTQDSLAESIGVSRGVIFNIEKNKTEAQTIVINAVCQTLKINKDWLISGIGEMKDKNNLSEDEKILTEIYEVSKRLTDKERLFLLDVVKALKERLNN